MHPNKGKEHKEHSLRLSATCLINIIIIIVIKQTSLSIGMLEEKTDCLVHALLISLYNTTLKFKS